jgi:protein-ribulosamine 3-kinase
VTVPAAVLSAVRSVLAGAGGGGDDAAVVAGAERLGGGCISPAVRLRLRDGRSFFLKWAERGTPAAMFPEEAWSLGRLAEAGFVRVPAVLGVEAGWLLLEWLEPGPGGRQDWAVLGGALAGLHRTPGPAFGWRADNFIGPLPQANPQHDAWPAFWREARLAPQLRRARAGGLLDARDDDRFGQLFERLDTLLAAGSAEGPSLLHGDLWSGNVHPLAEGGAALIDPASYYGHREVDLAMAALFGGFDRAFFDAYAAAWPLEPGATLRRAVYQLYYLLVHVNLFGGSYVAGTRAALDAALGG